MLVNVAARPVALLGQPSGETPESVNKHGDNSESIRRRSYPRQFNGVSSKQLIHDKRGRKGLGTSGRKSCQRLRGGVNEGRSSAVPSFGPLRSRCAA